MKFINFPCFQEVRRMIRAAFTHLAALKWKKEVRDEYWKVFEETVMGTGKWQKNRQKTTDFSVFSDKSFSEALKFHFASILLDEMDAAGGLTKKQVTACLKPYIEMLGSKETSDYLFSSIQDEVFKAILQQKSDMMASESDDEPSEAGGIEFNYKEISKMLFDVGKQAHLNAKRRKKIYELVKKFEKAAADKDPMHVEVAPPAEQLTKKDYEEAEKRAREIAEGFKKDKKEARKNKRWVETEIGLHLDRIRPETG